jgi:hypothetical protein
VSGRETEKGGEERERERENETKVSSQQGQINTKLLQPSSQSQGCTISIKLCRDELSHNTRAFVKIEETAARDRKSGKGARKIH